MWEAIIGSSISPEQVLLCMAALKIAREAGAHEPDNIEDATGYLSLIDEVRNWDTKMAAGPLPGGIMPAVRDEEQRALRPRDPEFYPPPRAG